MSNQKPENLEEKVFRGYWDDGLIDLFAGIALLVVGIGWALDQIVLAAVAPPLMVPIWKPLRQHLIEPRLGYVEFTERPLCQ